MRISSRGPQWAIVRATFDEISALCAGGIQDPNRPCGTPTISLDLTGRGNLLYTGAKAYYRKAGWWLIGGYSPNNSDINQLFYGDIYQ